MRIFPLLACCALVGCAQPADLGEATQPIIGGTDDTGDSAVMLLLTEDVTTKRAGLCTASVVSPHVLLTAAHCVDPAIFATDMGTPQLAYFVFPGNMINLTQPLPPGSLLAVKEAHFDPEFNPDPQVFSQKGHDIAVVILQNPVTVTPLPYNHTALAQSIVGQQVRVIGYGVTSASDTTGMTAGTKRMATTSVHALSDLFVQFQDPQSKSSICEGDSGGPALLKVNGVETIVGLTAFGLQGCPQNLPSYDTRVDTYADFVDQWVKMYDGMVPMPSPPDMATPGGGGNGGGNGNGGGGSGGGNGHAGGGCSLSPGPSASPAWLLAIVGLLLLARRRGRRVSSEI